MISIYTHLIDESQVIGIGPVMQKLSNSEVERTLYNSASFWFDLYLINYKIEISTNPLRFALGDKEASEAEFGRFKALHKALSTDLKNLVPLHVNFGT